MNKPAKPTIAELEAILDEAPGSIEIQPDGSVKTVAPMNKPAEPMTDLLAGAEPAITLADQIRCIEREIKMRQKVYPNLVSGGKMKPEAARIEMARMAAVLATLHTLEEKPRGGAFDSSPRPSLESASLASCRPDPAGSK